jgi:hypothetical protein
MTPVAGLWGLERIQAPLAWDVTTGSHSVVVAVIDTGVDYNHPDLAANMWTNPGEIPANGLDDDGNGFVDDVYGYDFGNRDGDPFDDVRHGTHVSGILGAVGNNAEGVVGVSWSVRIMAVKFLKAPNGSGSTLDAISSIQYAVNNGAQILSNSWGGETRSQALQDAITAANEAGVLFVASAGNSGSSTPLFPASMDGVLAVAATDQNDLKAPFSSFGGHVDVSAPGVDVLSTLPGRQYGLLSGTSMACPHTSGLAALIKTVNPALTHEQIVRVIQRTVDDLGAPGRDQVFAYGRINASAAVNDSVVLPQESYFVSQRLPQRVGAGQPFPATIIFRNVGTETWTAADGYELHSVGSSWGPSQLPLPHTVAPGETVTFTFTASPPSIQGTYDFAWQMGASGTLFGALSDNPRLVVHPPDLSLPHVFIINPDRNGATIRVSRGHPIYVVRALASDAESGLRDVTLYINDVSQGSIPGKLPGDPSDYTWDWNAFPFEGQTVRLRVTAVDNAGNARSLTYSMIHVR